MDDGSTVTDFLPAERARGITIQSAAISFHWPLLPKENGLDARTERTETNAPTSSSQVSHNINLIDTPGHADFTFEVLRSLRILDGAICILDGVAGVEAQTEKVWHQAANYNIPKIIYVNKLDREGAAFGNTVKDIASRLHAWPAVCQIPWWDGGKGRFTGIGDAVRLRALRWPEHGDGKAVKVIDLDELSNIEPGLAQEIKKARTALIEQLSEHDEQMVEKFLEYDADHLAISPADVIASLRRCVLSGSSNIVPVFAGASFRNIGIQPLLDAVVDLLPSPDEIPDPAIRIGSTSSKLGDLLSGRLVLDHPESQGKSKRATKLPQGLNNGVVANLEACALAFKVVNDPRRGVLVYVRVYSGSINSNATLFNTNLQVSERAPRLLKMYASDAVDVPTIAQGQIGVILGLKHARTGDTLISYTGANPKKAPPSPLNTLQLRPIEVPPPVFFASIEPHSLGEEKAVATALAFLLREDPSLQLSVDEDSGQTLLSGMGELHLEIAKDRLLVDLKCKATMGEIEIGYRECILQPSPSEEVISDREIAGRRSKAGCIASVKPFHPDQVFDTPSNKDEYLIHQDGNLISISIMEPPDPSDSSKSISDTDLSGTPVSHLNTQILQTALKNGALAALARGINHPYALHGTHVSLTLHPTTHLFDTDSPPSALSSAARLATRAALQSSARLAGTSLMEPVMNVIISVDEASLGAVVHDLSASRDGQIISLDDADVISAVSPNQTREDLPLIDLRKVYAPPDPFGVSSPSGEAGGQQVAGDRTRQRSITARVPLKEMVGYLKYLRSLTAGRGTFVMGFERFERVMGLREKALLKDLSGY